jgi:hypothetical protein
LSSERFLDDEAGEESDEGASTFLSSPIADGVDSLVDLTIAIAVFWELADFSEIGSDETALSAAAAAEAFAGVASSRDFLTGSALISLSSSLVSSSSLLVVESSLAEESSEEDVSEAETLIDSEVSVEVVSSEVVCSDEETSEVRVEEERS